MPAGHDRSGDVAQRFQSAWRRSVADAAPADLLPTFLASAAGEALDADGAGLSIFSDDHRVPIGASNAAATTAERLQFTMGEGPCLDALAHRRVVRVDEDQMRGDWPAYYAQLVGDTPYRSVVAVPFDVSDGCRGALDLYFVSPAMAPYVTVTDAGVVAERVSEVLTVASGASAPGSQWSALDAPAWMYGPPARGRLRVWVAVGVLMSRHNLPAADALTLLRAHAYSHDQAVEQISDAILDATADLDDFGPLPP